MVFIALREQFRHSDGQFGVVIMTGGHHWHLLRLVPRLTGGQQRTGKSQISNNLFAIIINNLYITQLHT